MSVFQHADAQTSVLPHPVVITEEIFVVSGNAKHTVPCLDIGERGHVFASLLDRPVNEISGDDNQVHVERVDAKTSASAHRAGKRRLI